MEYDVIWRDSSEVERSGELQHDHQNCVVILVLQGSGTYLLDQKIWGYAPNSLFIIPAHTLHASQSITPEYCRMMLQFSPSIPEKHSTPQTDLRPFFRQPRHLRLSTGQAAAVREQMEACRAKDERTFGGDLQRDMMFITLLLTISRYIQSAPEEGMEPAQSRITPVLEYVQANLGAQLTLERIAGDLYLNKYYLCHLFKKETGITLGDYIVRCRLKKAQELLECGCSVQKAAEVSGFGNYAHFIRTFTRHTGISPGKYGRRT